MAIVFLMKVNAYFIHYITYVHVMLIDKLHDI